MTLYDELIARGLIAQVTNEEEIKNMINNGKATFYIGFDCTADSLHVGHFMAPCLEEFYYGFLEVDSGVVRADGNFICRIHDGAHC